MTSLVTCHTTSRVRSLAGAAVAGVLLLALAACGGAEAGATSAGDDPVIAAPAGDEAARCLPEAVDCDDTPGEDVPIDEPVDAPAGPADDGDAMVPEEITLVAERPTDARAVELAPGAVAETWPVFLQSAYVDGADVTVTFSGGEAPCFVVDRVETDETAERVIVSVLVGVPDPDADCAGQETSIQMVSVQLDEPVGDRPLKDGSRTVPDGAQG